MDLQAAQQLGGKPSLLSKLTVALCLVVSFALLAGSLFSNGRSQSSHEPTLSQISRLA